jgi:hypothetical protein
MQPTEVSDWTKVLREELANLSQALVTVEDTNGEELRLLCARMCKISLNIACATFALQAAVAKVRSR